MAAGSRDRPPMLETGRYPQCPYKPTTILVQAVAATDDSPAIPEHTTVERPMNMSPANKAHFETEKEAIHLILTGIGDEIYSTVNASQTAQEMWEAIERLQQHESLNIQDVKTNLFWEFGKFTSHDGETMESYYTRFYKLMNEMIRNNLTVATMQVNVHFLQQLQPEWSRFVTIVKQQYKLDEVSYHNLFDILKQYKKEVNELRAERLARNANPLALGATAQANQDPYYQTSKSHKSIAPSSKPLIQSRTHTTTRYKGKEIAKPITPPSETASKEDNDPKQAQRNKDMQKNLALIAKYIKNIYKPTNNNLRTFSNSRNKNVDTTPRYKNDNQSGQFRNQRTVNVAGARENECRKPKRVKDSAYHKEKMLLCKQAVKGVPLQADQYDWLANTDEEIDEEELEAHYSYMAKMQEVPTTDTCTDSKPLEQVYNDTGYNVFANDLQHSEQSESASNICLVEADDSNVFPDSPDICDDDIQNDQNDVERDDERVAVANLKLDVDENKKIQKQLKKANTTLAQELKECKTILAETNKTLGESNSVRDSCLIALQNKHTEFEKYKAFNNRTIDYDKLECKLNETLGQLAQKDIEIKEVPTYNGRPTFANPRYLKKAQSEISCLYAFQYDQSTHANRLIPDGEETLALERESRSKLNKDSDIEILIQTCLMPLALKTQNDSFIFVHELKQAVHANLKYVESLEKEIDELEPDKPEFSNMYDMILQEYVSNEVMCSYLLSFSDLDALAELQCLYLHKVKECDCLAQKLSKQTESVTKEVHIELLQRFTKVEKHLISHEIALQKCIEQVKNDTFWNEQASNVFRKEREQYIKIQDLKAQLKDKNIAISKLKKLIKKTKSVPKTNVSEGLSKPVTGQTLPHTARQAVSNTNVLKPGMHRIENRTTQTRAPQSHQTVRNTNPWLSTSTGVNHKTNVSRPQHRSNQFKDKVKIDSDHFACVTKMLNDVNARTKKPNVVPISTRKPKGH
nr:hypothetical protein [Tanacetum cinerariifolium]